VPRGQLDKSLRPYSRLSRPEIIIIIITPWPYFAIELYRPNDHRHSAKLMPTFCGYLNKIFSTLRVSIPILSSQLRPVLPRGLIRSGFPNKLLNAFLISAMCAAYPVHLSYHNLNTLSHYTMPVPVPRRITNNLASLTSEGLLLVGCVRMLIQYIRKYPPYLPITGTERSKGINCLRPLKH
jgi:hypothetical protein